MGLLSVLCGLPIPFSLSFPVIGVLFWFVLFFGGFILPQVTGIMISSVEDDQKSSANSIANLGYSLFGYMPAPVIYGLIATWTNPDKEHPLLPSKSRWAMGALLYSTVITIGFLFYGIWSKLQQVQLDELNKTASPRHGNDQESKHSRSGLNLSTEFAMAEINEDT